MYECVIQVHSCPHSPRYYYTHSCMCVSLTITSDPKCYAFIFLVVQLFLFSLMHFLFVLIGARTHTHRSCSTNSLLFFFLSIRFFLVRSGVIMRFNFFAFLLFGFFSPFSPFHHHSLNSKRNIQIHIYTKVLHAKKLVSC